MSSNSIVDYTTRSMLNMTLQNIAQLESTLQCHLEQERGILLEIESLEYKLRDIRQACMQVTANITTIRESISKIKDVEQNLRCVLSPIKHLPNDILIHIFRILVGESDRNRDKRTGKWLLASRESRQIQLRLGQVCGRWRSIMRKNRSLWTSVDIRLTQDSDEARERSRLEASYWMKSGQPSDQRFFIDGWRSQQDESFWSGLGTEPTRWRAIHINLQGDTPNGAWDVAAHSAKEVTICRLKLITSRYFNPLMRQASVLVLYGPPPAWGTLPWISLKSLTIKGLATPRKEAIVLLAFGPTEFAALLLAAPELQKIVLDFQTSPQESTTETPHMITHRKISFLSLHLRYFVAGKGPFAVTLTAPSLQTLDFISLRCDSSVEDVPFVCQWDNPTILSLPTMKDDEVVLAAELMRWLPNVNTLQVIGRNVDALFTFMHSMLHHMPPQTKPLPLCKATSLFISDTDLRGETLIELLENRMRQIRGNHSSVSAVTEIKMYNSPAVTVSHWGRVQELLVEGIRSNEMVIEDKVDRSAGGQ